MALNMTLFVSQLHLDFVIYNDLQARDKQRAVSNIHARPQENARHFTRTNPPDPRK